MGSSGDVIRGVWGALAPHGSDFGAHVAPFSYQGVSVGVYVVIAVLGAIWLIFND